MKGFHVSASGAIQGHHGPLVMCLQYKSFENTVGKGESASNEQFLLFPQCFPPLWRTFCHFHQIENCHLLTVSFQMSFGKGLRLYSPVFVDDSMYSYSNIIKTPIIIAFGHGSRNVIYV